MSKTLSLSTRCHLFVDDDFLYIKVQKISPNFGKKDFYILKKFNISVLKELRDWANENLSRVPPTQEN